MFNTQYLTLIIIIKKKKKKLAQKQKTLNP